MQLEPNDQCMYAHRKYYITDILTKQCWLEQLLWTRAGRPEDKEYCTASQSS